MWPDHSRPQSHDPSDLRQRSRALAGPDFLRMRRVFISYSQPIRFARFDGKSVNRGLPVLDQASSRSLPRVRRIMGSGDENVAGPDFLSMCRVFVSYSQRIKFARFDGKSVNRGLPVLDKAKALDLCRMSEGSWLWGQEWTLTCFPPVMRRGPFGFSLIFWRSRRCPRCRCLKSLVAYQRPPLTLKEKICGKGHFIDDSSDFKTSL